MKIDQDKVAHIHYTLKDDQGQIIDQSSEQEPLAYIHGHGNIIPGLEQALHGKLAGDTLSVSVVPEQGYGERYDHLTQKVPKSMFSGMDEIEPGMQFHAQTDSGVQVVTVVRVEPDGIILDGNHPLAGQTLHFDVKIMQVREATQEELDHGHVHGEGGHHH